MDNMLSQNEVERGQAAINAMTQSVDTVIQGKHEVVELVVLALLARGHVLLEDLPGTGKTTLVSTLAKSIDCDFSRIQFTPDIMPSDVSGFSIFNQRTQDFEFRPGAGTYPLPEAQLDRFLIKLSMGYPDFRNEVQVLALGNNAKAAVRPVLSGADVERLRQVVDAVYASPMVLEYIVQIVESTRNNPEIQIGSSPRGGISLLNLSRAYALARGRGYVEPDDVKALAAPVLRHRLALSHEAKVAGRTADDVIASVISGIAVPYDERREAEVIEAVS